ncbi:MAG: alpha-L-rhamnosidase N-terminal domain-containing protein [Caulobacterales bacterium]|nr:alpha-L-rhamnosidase N-terminal domain-containing protein [Caulobacterales bacterium]
MPDSHAPQPGARAPFVWTPAQPIDPSGFLALIDGRPGRDDGQNRWFLFRTTLTLEAVPETAPLHVTVDGRYILHVNGTQVGRGPVRCSPLFQRYDSYDIAGQLRVGRNAVAVLVHTYGVDTAFHEAVRGMWAPTFGEGGLWVDGPVVSTAGEWRCRQSDAWRRETPRTNHSLGFVEAHDANLLPEDWTRPEFDDSAWDQARPLVAGGGGPEAPIGGMTVRPFPILEPRGIPHLTEADVTPARVLWVKGQEPRPEIGISRRLYQEPLHPPPLGAVVDPEHLLRGDDAPTVVRTGEGLDTAITVDFGRIFSGYPFIEIEAAGGEVVEIACAERLPGEWEAGGAAPDARITPMKLLGADAHLCSYAARPGRQRFQRFEWCAVRYMHVVVRGAPSGLTIRRLGAVETHYPVADRGRFSCSDPLLTRLWSLGAYTLKQCMHDAWEDCPSREQRQWLGDVTVENLAAWAAFGDSAAPLTAKFLIQAAQSQRPDGLTQMFAPGDHKHDAVLIPDWTLQWILCAHDHWMLTGDLATIEAIWPSIQKALAWFDHLSGPRGLVADVPYWQFMDWAGFGREGEPAPLNAQLAGALRAAAGLAAALEIPRAAARYRQRAEAIIAALDASHWDEARGVWVDMVCPRTGRQDLRTSQHAVAAMALWGDPPAGRLARAFDWATDPARETQTPAPPVVPHGTPLDEQNGVVMANTFYGHFVGEALARHGRTRTALAHIRRRFAPMVEAGATTLWEATTPDASLCHGFSASPTYFLSRHVLGVAPATPGFGRVRISPDLGDLDFAEGVAPAGGRDVAVRLERAGDGFTAHIEGAADAEVVAPPGLRLIQRDGGGGVLRARFARAT